MLIHYLINCDIVRHSILFFICIEHYSLEGANAIKEEKDDSAHANAKTANEAATIVTTPTTPTTTTIDNCKYSTVTIVPHKSDDSQNVLLKQLLQNSGSTASPMPTIVSRSVTSLRAPSLGVVSSLEAQLARPVILPVPATPNSIQSKTNALPTSKAIGPATQTFNIQLNSNAQKPIAISTSAATLLDTAKNAVRGHQILSRETSFISKPSGSDDKDDATKSYITTAAPSATQNFISTTAPTSSSITVVSGKSYCCGFIIIDFFFFGLNLFSISCPNVFLFSNFCQSILTFKKYLTPSCS